MTEEFEQGDIAECPYCGKEFEMNNISEDDFDDFDEYFMHLSMCR